MSNKKIGLVLGGGGTRGFAHLGAIKALNEIGIKPNVFSGTSAGAIVAALLAADKSPEEIMDFLKDIRLMDAAKITIPVVGFASLENLCNKLDTVLEGKNFEDLKYPLHVCVSNLNTGRVEYLDSGNVAKAVQASASIPILFTPVKINEFQYVDGGVLDNVPVLPLVDDCDMLIAIDISPVKPDSKITGMPEVITQILQMTVGMQQDKEEFCDILIRLDKLTEYNILDTSNNEKIFQIGYDHVKTMNIDYQEESKFNLKSFLGIE